MFFQIFSALRLRHFISVSCLLLMQYRILFHVGAMPTVEAKDGGFLNPDCDNCTKLLDPTLLLTYCVIANISGTKATFVVLCEERYQKFYTMQDCEEYLPGCLRTPKYVVCRCFDLCFGPLDEEEDRHYVEDSWCNSTGMICRQ